MKNKKYSNIYIKIGIITFSTAVLLVFYNLFESYSAEKASNELWIEINKNISEKLTDNLINEKIFEGISMPTLKIGNYKCIGELRIQKLGLNLPVLDTCDDYRLKKAPCRYNGSVYENNLIIAAHNYRSHFGRLFKINKGDIVQFVDADGYIYNYKVSDIEIINGNNKERLLDKDNGNWDLSLFTCTLARVTRFTVRCKKI